MKNQYVGDQNDYLKYALLRALAAESWQISVAWMLTPSDERSDGQRLGYLSQPGKFRALDPPLFDSLAAFVRGRDRTIHTIENSSIFPGAAYLSDILEDNQASRDRYFEDVWKTSRGRALLFFDPDNGLEVPSVRKGQRGSNKYLYFDELGTAYARQHSLVVYQHFPRRPRAAFLEEMAARIRMETDCSHTLFALTTSHVAFLILPQPVLTAQISVRLQRFSSHATPHATMSAFERGEATRGQQRIPKQPEPTGDQTRGDASNGLG